MAIYRFEIIREGCPVGFFEDLPKNLECIKHFNMYLEVPRIFYSDYVTAKSFRGICYFNSEGFRFFQHQIKELINYHIDSGHIVKMKVVPFNPRKEKKGLIYEDDYQLMLIERLAKKPNKVIEIKNKNDLDSIVYFRR